MAGKPGRANKQSKSAKAKELVAHVALKKVEFLKEYEKYGTITHAARAIGYERQQILRWRDADPAFDAAVLDAFEVNTEHLEQTLFQRALKGTSKGSDSLGMFMMKKRKPEYRDRFGIDASHLHAGVIANPTKVPPTVQAAVDALSIEAVKKIIEKF